MSCDECLVRLQVLESRLLRASNGLDASWVFSSSALLFLMQIGFAMLEGGIVREQNVVCTYTKNVLDVVVGVISTALGSFQLAYSDAPSLSELGGGNKADVLKALFAHIVYQATTSTIVSGALAERTALSAYLLLSAVISGLIFPLAVRVTWGGGFLSTMDPPFIDYAGSGVVHLVGGTVSLVGCVCVGSRQGRWDPIMQAQFVPHNVPSVINGTLMLWLGWYGFNPGSQAAISTEADLNIVANTFITTSYAGASAGLVVLIVTYVWTRGTIDVMSICNGLLCGLVAISAGSDMIDPSWSLVVGAAASVSYMGASRFFKYLHVDDVVDAVAVHGVGGLCGLLAVGLLHRHKGVVAGQGLQQLLSQAIGAVVLIALSASVSLAVCAPASYFGLLRVDGEEESKGLDSKLNMHAYAQSSMDMIRYSSMQQVMESCNVSAKNCVATLEFLKTIIHRPFTPNAADNKLMGETRDIIEFFDFTGDSGDILYLSFLSHKKTNGANVGRLFVDRVRAVLLDEGYLAQKPQARAVLSRLRSENLVFFDSQNLKDLTKLNEHVQQSRNHLLLLTAGVLERPWVLVEIVRAYELRLNFICILVEWGDTEISEDPRQFAFPREIDEALSRWRQFLHLHPVSAKAPLPSPSREARPVRERSLELQEVDTATCECPTEVEPAHSQPRHCHL
uniref:Ammonium transporter AmtB-like domain-containing protein n=1 Tax=Noctiluca scintillans TaxID=2966 RepID=A0A7S1FAN7_NOCSC|mmetsp:Transcript_45928/g.121791  ORF Transcript_45928/g.121791 Transcript_45928/m.121791 type:complete len:678 (-) Transcript_45928:56-2089(-)